MDKYIRLHLFDLLLQELVNKDGFVYLPTYQPREVKVYKSDVREVALKNGVDDSYSYIVKGWRGYKSISGVLLSRLQRAAGLTTSEVVPAIIEKGGGDKSLGTIQRKAKTDRFVTVESMEDSVFSAPIKGFTDINDAIEVELMNTRKVEEYDDKWAFIKDPVLREIFETVMTPECFDEYVLSQLVREVSGDIDGLGLNNLMVKYRNKPRASGVIPIDFEESVFIVDAIKFAAQKGFLDFVKDRAYSTASPINRRESPKTYEKRLLAIRKLIDGGYLTKKQVDGLKKAVGFDLTKEWESLCKIKQISGLAEGKDVASRLQEYNIDNLPELGL